MSNSRKKSRNRGRKKGNVLTRMAVWKKILLCSIGIVLCLVGMAGCYVMAKWDLMDTEDIQAEDIVINEEVKKNLDLGEGYTNIALFGVDTREGDLEEGTRSDAIIVASLNNKTKEIRMVSVYRDTLLDLGDGSTYEKCNAAYSYGGPKQAISMLNMNLDLDIQDYVTVDFGAIADVIDLLGGIELDVTDEEAEEMNNHILGTGLEAGKEVHYMEGGGHLLLDGVQATTYARVRSTAGGDFTRTERQRIVIEKIVEKAMQTDLVTLNKIIDQVFPQISTSFTLSEILTYATAYKEYTLGENTGFPFEEFRTTDTLSGKGDVVLASTLTENVSKLHEFLFDTKDYTPSSAVQTISDTIEYMASMMSTSGGTYTDGDTSSGQDYLYDDSYTQQENWSGDSYTDGYEENWTEDSYTGGWEEDNSYTEDPGDAGYYEDPSGGYVEDSYTDSSTYIDEGNSY